jgi:hypothetical protein
MKISKNTNLSNKNDSPFFPLKLHTPQKDKLIFKIEVLGYCGSGLSFSIVKKKIILIF